MGLVRGYFADIWFRVNRQLRWGYQPQTLQTSDTKELMALGRAEFAEQRREYNTEKCMYLQLMSLDGWQEIGDTWHHIYVDAVNWFSGDKKIFALTGLSAYNLGYWLSRSHYVVSQTYNIHLNHHGHCRHRD